MKRWLKNGAGVLGKRNVLLMTIALLTNMGMMEHADIAHQEEGQVFAIQLMLHMIGLKGATTQITINIIAKNFLHAPGETTVLPPPTLVTISMMRVATNPIVRRKQEVTDPTNAQMNQNVPSIVGNVTFVPQTKVVMKQHVPTFIAVH